MKRDRPLPLKECYRILQIKKGATLDAVKRAYRQKAFELHPDLHPDSPQASVHFQQLNEAYVALSQILQAQEDAVRAEEAARDAADRASRAAKAAQAAAKAQAAAREPTRETRQSAHEAYEQEQARAAAARAAAQAAAKARADAKTREQKADQARHEAETREARAQQDAGTSAQGEHSKEDVLRDLLNDPFARRVFEDIYSEIHRQERENRESQPPPSAASGPPPSPPPPTPKKIQMEWGNKKFHLDLTHGMAGAVKGWLRSQIDEEQSFHFPAPSLTPGARLRLQIRRGLSGELTTVEITLPPDFVIGKPVRLKGLGKRVGPWQGDLYLTFEPPGAH